MRSPVWLLVAALLGLGCAGGASVSRSEAPPVSRSPKPATSAAQGAEVGPALAASTIVASRTPVTLVDAGLGRQRFFPRATPERVGLDRAALEDLAAGAEESGTDAFIVLRDGHTVAERYADPDRPQSIHLRSVTKSVVSLAMGALWHDGKIPSLDAPLSNWYRSWALGPRKAITLYHVMTHTSGLETRPTDLAIYAERDSLAYARTLAVEHPPGEHHAYNNEAVQLLSGVVRATAGMPLDEYVQKRIFDPIGVHSAQWEKDLAGNCLAYAGLSLAPRDLARLGQLMAARGQWQGRQIVPREWFDQATQPAPGAPAYGLLVELYFDAYTHVSTRAALAAMERAGFPFAEKLQPLVGRPFHYRAAYWLEAGALLSASDRADLVNALEHRRAWLPFESKPGRQSGFGHSGTYGQYLMVFPDYGLVVVRLVREFDTSRPRVDFEENVQVLLRQSGLSGSG